MGALWQDVRYGLRMLAKNPGFTAVAVLTLALGIGANTVLFSVVNAVLLRPLPFPNPDDLVLIWGTDLERGVNRGTIPPADFQDWREQNRAFEGIAAWQTWFYNLTGNGEPEQVWGVHASANFFQILGVHPALGRAFLSEEEQPGHGQVVILSHGLWEQRFGADPNLIGKSITIDDRPFTVTGILPAGFNLFGTSRRYDLWMPLVLEPAQLRRDNPSLIVFGRLKPGVTLQQAQAEMNTITGRLQQEYPATNRGSGALVVSLHDDLTRRYRPALAVLLAAVGFVLLIACANVANLLLARATGRQREIAIRAVLGAGRLRLIRQLLTESVLLALLGGLLGLLLAFWGLHLVRWVLPPAGGTIELPHSQWIGLNRSVLGFALLLSILTGIIFGSAPAFQISRTDLNESLKEGDRGSTGGWHAHHLRGLLVISEFALSLVLLIGAGLLIRSFLKLLALDLGFDPKNVLTMQVWLPESRYPNSQQVQNFYQQALERIQALPGVRSASAINFLPLSRWGDFSDFAIEGRPAPTPGHEFNTQYRVIDPNYFRTMGIPLLRGRFLTESDGDQASGAVVINRTLARRYWPHENPLGKRVHLILANAGSPWRPQVMDSWLTIVGIVGDVKEPDLGKERFGQIYLPYLQNSSRLMRLVVRTGSDPMSLAPAVRQALLTVNADQPVTEIKTMEQFLSESVAPRRLNMVLLGLFAALALILAAGGIYGVMAYSVSQRAHEIGVRMALGARPSDVLALVVKQGLALALIGLAIGLAAAFALTHLMGSLLFGVTSTDPATFAGVSVLLLAVALLACYVPARRTTHVDPMVALRYE